MITKRNLQQLFSSIVLLILLCACASKKNVLYMQDIDSYHTGNQTSKNIIKFKKNDEITITVSSADGKSAIPFNLPLISQSNGDSFNGQRVLQSYLVNKDGYIQFPIIGEIKVLGMTQSELNKSLITKISKYVKDPIINIKITNFRISVIGEVRKPGVYNVRGQRMSVIEAISNAGDLSVYGKRKEILVIREDHNGIKHHKKLDITSSKILDSDFYYLHQNDIVMVSPNKAQVQSSAFNRNTPIYVSIASLLLSVLTIFGRNIF